MVKQLSVFVQNRSGKLAAAMRRLGADKAECLMVGDRFHDAEGAQEQGVDCALLAVGYAADGEISAAQPQYAFENFAALTEFLTRTE